MAITTGSKVRLLHLDNYPGNATRLTIGKIYTVIRGIGPYSNKSVLVANDLGYAVNLMISRLALVSDDATNSDSDTEKDLFVTTYRNSAGVLV